MQYSLLTPVPTFDLHMNQLTDSWTIWNNDSSLRSVQRFGQYVLNKYLPAGMTWAECFYADTSKAYEMLYQVTQETKERHLRQIALAPVDYLDI